MQPRVFPNNLKKFYKRNSVDLNETQKNIFAKFLGEFQDVFSEQIVTENCDVLHHEIHLQDSCPIKQAPRRVPIEMQAEMEKILQEMKDQEIIEESFSP